MKKLALTGERKSCDGLCSEHQNLTVPSNLARQLFGSNAALAVAYCAIDARIDGRQEDFQKWVTVFKQLKGVN